MAWKWIAIGMLALAASACANEGVGDPCIPENIPCDPDNQNNCGFGDTESFIESSSVQCRSRLCIVHKLEGGADLADPRDICGQDEGILWPRAAGGSGIDGDNCVSQGQLNDSVYCTCRCGGPKKTRDFCECPSGFSCQEILTLGGDGIRGNYCVRPRDT